MLDNCALAVSCGTNAILVSNHSGRQLDGTGAPLDYLLNIRDRIGDGAQLIVDGGVRRGTDVLKAIALGTNGCLIGRPYLYGFTMGGDAGVAQVLSIVRSEIERDLALMGRTRPADIGANDINHLSDYRVKPNSLPAAPRAFAVQVSP